MHYILQEKIICGPVKSIFCMFAISFVVLGSLQYHIYTVFISFNIFYFVCIYFSLCTFQLHRMHFYLKLLHCLILWWIYISIVFREVFKVEFIAAQDVCCVSLREQKPRTGVLHRYYAELVVYCRYYAVVL